MAFDFISMKGQKLMYFTETDTLRKIKRLMQNIPNFPQKGHGIIILQSGNRIHDECICCMHRGERLSDYDCGYGESSCIVQRIRHEKALPDEVFRKTLYAAVFPPFQKRLNQYIKESEEEPMDYRNEKHRAIFESFIKKRDQNNQALMSALYLLTADFMLWRSVKFCIGNNVICFEQIHLHGTIVYSYLLFCAAKDLYRLTVSDLVDKNVVPPKAFRLICNAVAIRRFGLGAITSMKQRGEPEDCIEESQNLNQKRENT